MAAILDANLQRVTNLTIFGQKVRGQGNQMCGLDHQHSMRPSILDFKDDVHLLEIRLTLIFDFLLLKLIVVERG